VAIYTVDDGTEQSQNLAYSVDEGHTWIEYENNPVLKIQNEKNFRAPKIFWHPNVNKWIMTVTLIKEKRVVFYSSKDLKSWVLTGDFKIDSKFLEETVDYEWGTTDLFPLMKDDKSGNYKWVMTVNL